jgi:hypothetical protein
MREPIKTGGRVVTPDCVILERESTVGRVLGAVVLSESALKDSHRHGGLPSRPLTLSIV